VTAGGRLLVCATPIGNLGDVTLRVLDALRDADTIAAEDTRVTRKLLSHYDIHTPLESYHAGNLEARTSVLVERIGDGATVAVVSDAGTPGISDPGARLVDACLDADLAIEVLPGPSAIVTALAASGLPTHAFYFGGFLPRKRGPLARRLEALAALDATLVFYESPRRTAATLAAAAETLGDRQAAIARELTKVHEEVVRGTLAGLADELGARELKGEVVVLIGPPEGTRHAEPDPEAVRAEVQARVDAGRSRRDAVADVADALGLRKNAVYRIALDEDEEV
jgi:16S rRNA (cytidine1402-2'-O)-methyltransferase